MPPTPTYRISIEAEFGSEIQRDVSLKVLREYLGGWEQSVLSAHKKNKVIISEREISSETHQTEPTGRARPTRQNR